ncbi:RND family efflux transporter, MFP subunit [Roseomonas rosea]|uniref:RND family efflux transporter, MFP subunit n=1 Tax=Muricoccus roseus TaxID=198092 RepID=A0A1M6PUK9_9PROT|nr:efflux RND transporter periplasmic adaptor subunit [Roseomonas rosea]SHK11562.1 RND family efflux transporter, MFP subunit [Roseomonas rosea]
MRFVGSTLRVLVTLAMVALAVVAATALWRTYMLSPWTRDGRVQAQVVNVASEVAGTVLDVQVTDNQPVRKGDVLFQVDPSRFALALQQARAALDGAQSQMELARSEARRQQQLRSYASEEARERASTTLNVAEATLASARVSFSVAQLNLTRSTVTSPVNGFVTHLRLRPGSYVNAGAAQVAIVDADSFWVDGYFEETKISGIHPGDQARIRLMSHEAVLSGEVESIGRGISDSNDAVNSRGLPTVNPIFTWVRLAQRIPVRIRIGALPSGLTLVAGMTASVAVGEEAASPTDWSGRVMAWIRDHL